MLYDEFKPIVDLVLNNWTALQLAVEHGMGAPGGKETAQLMSVYVARYCVENIIDLDNLIEVLEDIMDEEFETNCHDDSPREVANLLMHFLGMLKDGRHAELQEQLDSMPKCELWLSQHVHKSVPPQSHGNPDDDTTSSGDDDDGDDDENASAMNANNQASSSGNGTQDEPMEQDPGWTVVKTRRKK